MQTFETGATRNNSDNKFDFEGFLSPLVLKRYAEYMHKNRMQDDGTIRPSDNWQKGITYESYMKSMWRHFMDVWTNHRNYDAPEDTETALCAVMFNTMGYLHERLKDTKDLHEYEEKDRAIPHVHIIPNHMNKEFFYAGTEPVLDMRKEI